MEVKTIIANKNVVKKVGQQEGKTIQIGNARLTWKAMGVDTAYGTSLYELDLAPGVGIPVHSHPYAEIFYVISGYVDSCATTRMTSRNGFAAGPAIR